MQLRAMCCLIALVLGCLPGVGAEDAPEQKGGFTCGLNAAYIFLNRAGRHVGYEQLSREFEAENAPDTLLAIKDVLRRHGCRTEGIQASAAYFLDKPGPAIVYLQLSGYTREPENHFAYMVGASRRGGVEFLDPVFNINKAAFLTWDAFSQSYQGFALIPDE